MYNKKYIKGINLIFNSIIVFTLLSFLVNFELNAQNCAEGWKDFCESLNKAYENLKTRNEIYLEEKDFELINFRDDESFRREIIHLLDQKGYNGDLKKVKILILKYSTDKWDVRVVSKDPRVVETTRQSMLKEYVDWLGASPGVYEEQVSRDTLLPLLTETNVIIKTPKFTIAGEDQVNLNTFLEACSRPLDKYHIDEYHIDVVLKVIQDGLMFKKDQRENFEIEYANTILLKLQDRQKLSSDVKSLVKVEDTELVNFGKMSGVLTILRLDPTQDRERLCDIYRSLGGDKADVNAASNGFNGTVLFDKTQDKKRDFLIEKVFDELDPAQQKDLMKRLIKFKLTGILDDIGVAKTLNGKTRNNRQNANNVCAFEGLGDDKGKGATRVLFNVVEANQKKQPESIIVTFKTQHAGTDDRDYTNKIDNSARVGTTPEDLSIVERRIKYLKSQE